MSQNLHNCFYKLFVIANIKDKRIRNELLAKISCKNDIYSALSEIAKNVVAKNVPLTRSQKIKLKKYKKKIIALSCDTKDKKIRQNRVVQSGGFLNILLPAVASVIGPLLFEKLK